MKWPTTLILLTTLVGSILLTYVERLDAAAFTSIAGTVIGAVTVGHYVKTTNGLTTTTTTSETGGGTTTTRSGRSTEGDGL